MYVLIQLVVAWDFPNQPGTVLTSTCRVGLSSPGQAVHIRCAWVKSLDAM